MTQKLEATMNVDAIRGILTYNSDRPSPSMKSSRAFPLPAD
jgi:hypothetical protein